MAFKGDLANISLFDVFQTLNTNRQAGVLVLRRDGVMKKIYFSPEGVRIFFTKSARPLRLGEVFIQALRLIVPDAPEFHAVSVEPTQSVEEMRSAIAVALKNADQGGRTHRRRPHRHRMCAAPDPQRR